MNITQSSYSDIEIYEAPSTVSIEFANDFICKRARELASELIENRGRIEPPFKAKEYADMLGIPVEKVYLGNAEGLLLKRHDGYTIKLNENRHPDRQNFSCAHEIGHTFLHELGAPIEVVHDEYRRHYARSAAKAKEHLCDTAAAELLMPQDIFKKYLEGYGISINSVELLAHAFKVSIQAAAFRIPEVISEACYTIRWKQCQKPRSKGFEGYFMRKPLYLRNPSPISRAFDSEKPDKTFKAFEINRTKKRCWMESKAFGYGSTRFVVSLVFPDGKGK